MKHETLRCKVAIDLMAIGYLPSSSLNVDVLVLNVIRHYLQALDLGYSDLADECVNNMRALDTWRREEWER